MLPWQLTAMQVLNIAYPALAHPDIPCRVDFLNLIRSFGNPKKVSRVAAGAAPTGPGNLPTVRPAKVNGSIMPSEEIHSFRTRRDLFFRAWSPSSPGKSRNPTTRTAKTGRSRKDRQKDIKRHKETWRFKSTTRKKNKEMLYWKSFGQWSLSCTARFLGTGPQMEISVTLAIFHIAGQKGQVTQDQKLRLAPKAGGSSDGLPGLPLSFVKVRRLLKIKKDKTWKNM